MRHLASGKITRGMLPLLWRSSTDVSAVTPREESHCSHRPDETCIGIF
jgi:hypothetical protein